MSRELCDGTTGETSQQVASHEGLIVFDATGFYSLRQVNCISNCKESTVAWPSLPVSDEDLLCSAGIRGAVAARAVDCRELFEKVRRWSCVEAVV